MTIALKQQIGIRGRVVAVGTIAAACLMCASGPASAQAVSHGNPIVRLAKKSVREAKLHNIAVNLTTGWAASPSGGLTTDLSVKFLFNDRPFSFESFRLSAVLTSTDLTTGARTKLLTRRNTIPYSLASGYGHTYGIWYRIDSWRKERFRMQLVELSDPKHPRELLSEAFGDEGGDCLPGRVTGVTPQGEAILVRPMLGERC
ncbi:MAG: hypothetical protein JHC87_01855, partial [Thermoleophilaceae bacterium]|nr:hypothetical protein [Thermoleophilaceae bacterium]